MCSADMREFISDHHLNLSMDGTLNPREAFGSHDDADHVYNTPRAWYMLRCLNPHTYNWDGPDADFTPESDDLPWTLVPERKITVEDVKYVLSSHYQGTPYDPYGAYGDPGQRGMYRSIGINRNDLLVWYISARSMERMPMYWNGLRMVPMPLMPWCRFMHRWRKLRNMWPIRQQKFLRIILLGKPDDWCDGRCLL